MLHSMGLTLPLDKMTLADKLQAMEALWQDLSNSGQAPSPEWHKTILEDRLRKVASGDEVPVDWEIAKRELRTRLR